MNKKIKEVVSLKRKLAVVLTIFMLVSVLSPLHSFAAEDSKGLEKAIKTAKSYFDVPEDYKLVSSFGNYNGKKVWYLNWYSEDGTGSSIDARIDENGTLLYYYRYKPEYYKNSQSKFPAVSKDKAREAAENFIKKVNPSVFNKIKYQEDNQNTLLDRSYYFYYVRSENNVPYSENYINITVHRDTGEVTDYYCYWTDGLTFPDVSKAISIEKAQEAYRDKIGLKLIYQSAKVKNETKVFPVYVPKYDNYSYVIDAITGERINISPYYGIYYDRGGNMIAEEAAKNAAGASAEITLSPEEEKEVKKMSDLISLEEAEKIARDSRVIGLDKNIKLEHYNLSREWYNDGEILWSLSFASYPEKNSEEEYKYASVTINAKTGEIIRFYMSTPYNANDKAKDDKDAAKAAVEKFLKEFKPDKFEQVELDQDSSQDITIMNDSEQPRSYWFHFSRKVNGILFPDNGFSITYDAVNQKVTDFSMAWYDVEFPSIENVAPVENVYDVLFEQVGMELQYKGDYDKTVEYIREIENEKPEIKLVYMLKSGKPLYFDAYTGNIVNYDGTPYKEYKPVEYTDIKGHFAEKQIKALAEHGVYLEGEEFKPAQQIKQKEFFALLTKTMDYYYGPVLSADSSQEDIDNMYSYLIREKIITADEKNPEGAVSREDAVKYIIKSLKYNEVAEIKGIYNCPFADKDEINPDLVGYVTIAYGLKIVSGASGNFMPKGTLTRAEAAIMIYNYLQR